MHSPPARSRTIRPQPIGSDSTLQLRVSLPSAGLDTSMTFHVRPGSSLRKIKRALNASMDALSAELAAELVADSRTSSSEFSAFFADADRQLREAQQKQQDAPRTGLRMPYLKPEMHRVCKNRQGEAERQNASGEDEQLMQDEDGRHKPSRAATLGCGQHHVRSRDHKSRAQTVDFGQAEIRAVIEQLHDGSSDCESSASNDTVVDRDTSSSEEQSSHGNDQEVAAKSMTAAGSSPAEGQPSRSSTLGVTVPFPEPRSLSKQRPNLPISPRLVGARMETTEQYTAFSPRANSRQDVSIPRQDAVKIQRESEEPNKVARANPRRRFLKPLQANTFRTAPPAIGRQRDDWTFRPMDRLMSSGAKNYEVFDGSDDEASPPSSPKSLPGRKPPSRSSSPNMNLQQKTSDVADAVAASTASSSKARVATHQK
eukprot:TRINITY_DN15347_c0_g1_i1.p1 TRINITY_DN15347_c0_g1~~TRINITY_DN15347_c0_g1_i1.p1  ORF type:complete len:427 (-),score=71.73 TRINITY_DN15347_c0_g1_i1:32-1312(-)